MAPPETPSIVDCHSAPAQRLRAADSKLNPHKPEACSSPGPTTLPRKKQTANHKFGLSVSGASSSPRKAKLLPEHLLSPCAPRASSSPGINSNTQLRENQTANSKLQSANSTSDEYSFETSPSPGHSSLLYENRAAKSKFCSDANSSTIHPAPVTEQQAADSRLSPCASKASNSLPRHSPLLPKSKVAYVKSIICMPDAKTSVTLEPENQATNSDLCHSLPGTSFLPGQGGAANSQLSLCATNSGSSHGYTKGTYILFLINHGFNKTSEPSGLFC